MKKHRLFILDAFTSHPFQGNPAGVVLDAEKLTDEEMQKIAKEINLSETAFISKSNNNEVSFKIRYFTPTKEIDFCGHATIAASWIILTQGLIDNKNLTLETNIGIIPITYEFKDNKLAKVVMTQVTPKVKDVNDDINYLCELLGLQEVDIDNRYPLKYAYTGNWHLLIPVKAKAAIDNAKPNFAKLKDHNISNRVATTHLFTFDSSDSLLYTRDFAPSSGINEDPVTGSANGALAGYLAIEGIINQNEYKIIQGNSLNRLGELFIKVNKIDNSYSIQVGGSAIITIDGYINL